MTHRPPAQRLRPRRWIRILLPAVLVLAWMVVASIGGPTFGKLSTVSTNDQASFLPASAESTEVRDWQQRFTDSDAIPAVIVIESAEKIPASDLRSFAELGEKLGAVEWVQDAPAGEATSVAGPIPSEDAEAIQFIVPITGTDELRTVVADLRAVLADSLPTGLTGYVTGPAGLTADLVSAFGGIDGLLLLVAVGAVFIILLLVYRSVVLPLLVLLTSIVALTGAILLVFAFASWGWISLSGQSQGILSILVIGAATDYSLLLVARSREALQQHESKWEAIWRAWRAALEPIVASGATVIIALLCLLFSDLNSNRSLGPIAALGIVFALLATLTFLPMLLVVFGRGAFWPFRPAYGQPRQPRHENPVEPIAGLEGITGLWRRVGALVAHRPRITWLAAVGVLGLLCLGLPQLQANGVSQTDLVLTRSDSVDGQRVSAKHFPDGAGSPIVIIADADNSDAVLEAVGRTPGIESASLYSGSGRPPAPGEPVPEPVTEGGRHLINAVLDFEADSTEAEAVVADLRTSLPDEDPGVLVGGVTAVALDTNVTAQSDLVKIVPIVLVVILIILMLLLRSVLAPVLLIASVVVSYAAALGAAALVFNHVLDFPGADASVPLFGFVFLVALGVDYNIFLMTRVREEAVLLGTRPGILRGLGLTGSVITSAGVVLAATFAALAVIPILFLAQIAFIVAFGVLLDTIIVRSLIIPALAYDIGPAIWWPSKLTRA